MWGAHVNREPCELGSQMGYRVHTFGFDEFDLTLKAQQPPLPAGVVFVALSQSSGERIAYLEIYLSVVYSFILEMHI